ncbi:MAG: dimethylarginine dimethylaminohydrolase [Naasia sp.]|uniref:dimethylargininase n=1 Tax=Naasia sp. TaxID=2546198 RepID=UPI002605215C|nr:dimethylargininase [Naasia sp.]MCU1571682.1 dimethylarginine dimethylaminohydrolase [Naasia sp.]
MNQPPSRRLLAAALAAAVTALVAHAATVFLFFVGNSFAATVLGAANAFFGLATLVSFLLLLAGGYLTGFRTRPLALAVGVVAGVLGAVAGTTAGAVLAGSALGGDLLASVAPTLAGVNLTFVLCTALAAVALAPALRRRVADSRPAVLRRGRTALVRLPSATLEQGAVSHLERVPVDTARADEQWAAYVDAFRDEGWEVLEVPVADELADSVFVEDTVVLFGSLAVLTRPGAEHRRDELPGVEDILRSLGIRATRIVEPGTLDGGDVLKVGSTVYVGRGGRTNAEGIRQLRTAIVPLGFRVVPVPTSRVLHLKSAVTALPDGTVIGSAATVDDARIFPSFREMPEPAGAQVVVLDDSTVLMAASAPRSAALLESLGYRVVTVDISEFEKLEGGITCLSVRLR